MPLTSSWRGPGVAGAPSRSAQTMTSARKLLVSDVDGTLVTNDKQLTAKSIAAVRALADADVAFALTSSRPPFGLRMLIERLAVRAPVAAFNGGLIFAGEGSVPLEAHSIPVHVARRAVASLQRMGVGIWFDTDRDWFLLDPSGDYVSHEVLTIATAPKQVASFDQPGIIDRGFKIVGVSRDFDLLARCETELGKELGSAATVARSQRYYLDITHPTANKGHAVQALANLLGIDLAAVAVIGDGGNDVAMFEVAGLAIAMGNASAEVKARAQFVTSSNEQDGFAAAVSRWILPWAAAGHEPSIHPHPEC